MSELPLSTGSLFIFAAFALLSVITLFAYDYFSPEKFEMRAIKRKRRKRRRAIQFLRSTAERKHFNEFTRVQ